MGPIGNKRPVARHACLACREKKVKCDGEQLPQPGDPPMEVRRQRCSNCKSLGIECVFVRSQRGGRRKRDDSTRSSLTAASPESTSVPLSSAMSTNGVSATPSWLQSPLLPSRGSTHTLQEKVQQLQREAADLQSQILDRSDSASISGSEYFSRSGYNNGPRNLYDRPPPPPAWGHGPPPPPHTYPAPPPHHPGPPPYHPGPPYPPHMDLGEPKGLGRRRHHHRHHHMGPPRPPGPMMDGRSPPPPPMDGHGHHGYPGRPRPPPPMDSRGATSFMPEERRPYSVGEFDMNMPKLSRNTEFIHISDQELEQFDLPNWSTTCLLIDLYYRYVYPSRPFLAPKHRLIYQLQVRQDASLLHAMFSSSCRFASSIVMPNANLRDPQHWYFLAEKYWDLMELDTALQALVLLMGSLGPGGYVQQSIEGSERTFSLMKVTNTLESHNIRDWNSFAQIATKRQVVKHEDMLRTIWSSWKLNVFIRMNRGSPFHQLSTNLLQFPSDLPLPLSDSQYNSNMYMFDVTDNHGLAKLSYRRWKDLKLDLLEAANSSAGFKSFSDSDLTIIAIKHMEDIMDTISSGFLNSESVNRFNQSIKVTDNIINSSLYQISHIKKKMAIVNISKLFALLVNALCKIVINVTQCHKILLIKPHETHSNSNPDDVFNSLYESKLEDIHQACLSISPEQLQHFITAFTAALDVVRLIELGMGKIPEAATSAVPIQVIGGPANLSPASEISSLKTSESWWISAIQEPGKSMSAQVQTYNEYPDIWLQYPIFSVVIVANALTVMASAVVLTKMMTLREVESMDSGSGSTNVEWIVGNRQHVVPTMMDQTTLDVVKRSFNVIEIHESISLCSKYINVHGRFWPYVESVSYQVEAIMNYIDDIVMKS